MAQKYHKVGWTFAENDPMWILIEGLSRDHHENSPGKVAKKMYEDRAELCVAGWDVYDEKTLGLFREVLRRPKLRNLVTKLVECDQKLIEKFTATLRETVSANRKR